MEKSNVTEIMDIGILDPKEMQFFLSDNGFVGLKYLDKEYIRVVLSRTLPFEKLEEYISVVDTENKEIGILRNIEDLSAEQALIVRNELAKRYYCPAVLEILSIKEKMGYVYFDIRIQGGTRTFAVKDVSRNIRQLESGSIIIFDVDGNRFIIPNYSDLDAKSMKRIDSYLF